MKRTLISLAASLGCLMLSSTVLTAEYSGWAYNIPFSFNVSGIVMPAGHYTVMPESEHVSILRGPTRAICYDRTPQLSAKSHAAHLTFHKYGDAYFLSEVWEADGQGKKLPTSAREHEVQRTLQMTRIQPQTVLVAAAE